MTRRAEDSWTSASLILRVGRSPTDEAAWAEFVDRYGPKVLGWSRGWGLQQADAEDVTQAVMVKLSRQMGRFAYDDGKGSFRGWLQTLARNAWRDWASQRARAGGRPIGDAALASVEAREDFVRRLEETFDLEVLVEAVHRVRERVADKTWEAYKLAAIEDRPAAEVAARLQMTVVNVFKAKSNVLRRVRDEVRALEEGTAGAVAPWATHAERSDAG